MKQQLVFIGSTGGAVLTRLLRQAFVREMTLEVVADRDCGFLDVASAAGVPAVKLPASSGAAFSELLLQRYGQRRDIRFLSFYTRLFSAPFVEHAAGRLFNCHPSLLPAFKGMHGFEDTWASRSALLMGCTLHEVDAGMDSGASVVQAVLPINRAAGMAANRHRLYLAQCQSTLQFLRWLQQGRLQRGPDGHWSVLGASTAPAVFVPNLDADFYAFTGEADELQPLPAR
jgi:phosphoribosylglycinamide formyltransferase 1